MCRSHLWHNHRRRERMTKDILNTLTAALTASANPQPEVPAQKWYMCVSDRQGGVQTFEAHDVFHAESMTHEWLAAGWPAWVQSEDGNLLTIAKQPNGYN